MTCDHCKREMSAPSLIVERGYPRVRVRLCQECMMRRPTARIPFAMIPTADCQGELSTRSDMSRRQSSHRKHVRVRR